MALISFVGLGTTGCSGGSAAGGGDEVTYLLEVDTPVATPLGTVVADGSRGDGDPFAPQEFPDQETSLPVQDASAWKESMDVPAGSRAQVRATPPAGVLARCHILLEDGSEIASAAAPAAGVPVECSADIPAAKGDQETHER